ncbi:MAG TPA: response regulator transcription factor [Rhizomicrobium sp.]|nr:response regulator transcription factor [Rhizomicrobium sp.]
MQNAIKKTQIYLVDDHPLVRESLANLINQQPDLAVCGEADSAGRALREIVALAPDLAIIDISLKESSGLELIKAVKAQLPQLAVVVLSMHDEQLYAERCIRAGAAGYVMKRESSKQIVAAVREVMADRMGVSSQIAAVFARKFVGGRQARGESPISSLSDRELEVFGLLGRGMATRQVAENMNVSIKTVQAYCGRIKQKLHISTATELLREAIHWHDQNNEGVVY